MEINYGECIKYIYPTSNSSDYKLKDDGNGVYISYWNVAKLGSQPTFENLSSVWPAVYWKLLIKEITDAVQVMLDTAAHERGYDNMFTMISYLNSTNLHFKAEAETGLLWRDAIWDKCLELQENIQKGLITINTVEEFMSELPQVDWSYIDG